LKHKKGEKEIMMSDRSSCAGISANLEDYLEAISLLQAEHRVARAKDIADRLSVTRASVTGALKALSERGLINYEPYSFVTLTREGRRMADDIIHRHQTLQDFFENILGLTTAQSEANACRAEHAMDSDAMNRLLLFMEFMKKSQEDTNWREAFEAHCQESKVPRPRRTRQKKTG
jgi:DtxR family transcriptional regulator, Mn-dependent transcriptional regulator